MRERVNITEELNTLCKIPFLLHIFQKPSDAEASERGKGFTTLPQIKSESVAWTAYDF